MNKETKNAAKLIKSSFNEGGKLLACGNGGSASQADHFIGELVCSGFPAISLTNSAIITAIANDYSYNQVFSRQIEALGREGDVLLMLTTSGKSNNILQASLAARRVGMSTIALIGNNDDTTLMFSDVVLMTNRNRSQSTQRIQEQHIKWLHQIWKNLGGIKWPDFI